MRLQIKKSSFKRYWPYIAIPVVYLLLILLLSLNTKVHKINYTELLNDIENNKVKEITITPLQKNGVYELKGTLKGYQKKEYFKVLAPISEKVLDQVIEKQNVKVNGKIKKLYDYKIVTANDPSAPSILSFIFDLLPYLIIGGIAYFFIKNQLQSAGKSIDFGKSTAKLSTKPKFTFKDVAGLNEEKQEVREMIDFLKSPKKFTEMGARIPKGLLLVGPPGTGKTLLAKAVAGEAKVPFLYLSGSDFLELFVGVGASRVRDLFKQAKALAPCLIFIDELDTIGRRRGTGNGGGDDEREQTLNQLLSEMDGFEDNQGVIVMGATNRADVLDPALLRPGRFDRQIRVDLPDKNERLEILKVHAKNKKLSNDVNLKNLANRTPGFSGADLEQVLNEAALLAVRNSKKLITMTEIEEGTDRVVGGPAKVSRKYTDHEKKVVAYHEAGHAVIGIKLKNAEQVHKITIIPRGDAGGYTIMLPDEEKFMTTKQELIDRIIGLFGGRASEEIFFDDVTTGAHNDFEKATAIARALVTEYGMSTLGPVQLESRRSGYFLGNSEASKNYSDEVAYKIDQEVDKILRDCYEKSKKVIKENEDLIHLLANVLIEKETLNKEEIDHLVKTGKLPIEAPERTLDELKEEAKAKKIKGYSKMSKEELESVLVEEEE